MVPSTDEVKENQNWVQFIKEKSIEAIYFYLEEDDLITL